ncbi:hypothetical protein BX616_007850, partial [Lobosporangium transversale]
MAGHYEEACVRHALADHAQRLLPETMTASTREFQKGIRAGSSPYLVLELSRSRLVEEAFEQITRKHSDLKKPLKVAFVDVGEEGMDQGGVTKEFFQIIVEKVFDAQFGLFKELEEGRCWWFEGVLDGSSHVEMTEKDIRMRLVEYELVGILVGLALYNGVILGVRFPTVVYRKLLGWEISLDSFMESFPNPFLFEQPYQETLLRRILLIFTAFSDTGTLKQWLSYMDEEGMAQLVTLFKMYLSAHFTPRPTGANHPAICAVKGLSILYEANNIGARREQEKQRRLAIKKAMEGRQTAIPQAPSTISYKYFYSGVMEALKFKDEYQIW